MLKEQVLRSHDQARDLQSRMRARPLSMDPRGEITW